MPLGIHDCELGEIEAALVIDENRLSIWQGFLEFIAAIAPIPELDLMYVDGGFVTDHPHPKDIDIVIELPDAVTLVRVFNNYPILQNRKSVHDRYKTDLLFCLPQLPAGINDLREYFQYLRPEDAIRRGLPKGTKKGILRISLRT